MNKILVVTVNWFGDTVFSTPVFRAIKQKDPGVRLCCLAVPRVVEALRQVPWVDEIIVYDEKGRDRWLWGKLKLIAHLRAQRFDAAVLLHGSWTRALLVFLAGIPVRAGYDTKKRGWLLTHRLPAVKGPVHRSDLYAKVLEPLGITVEDRTTFVELDAKAQAEVKEESVS